MASPLQRAALAHAAACEPGVPRFVRAVALLEAAGALDQLAYRLDLRATARHDARVGADLLLDLLADGLVAVPSDWVAGALASVVRQASRLLDGQPLAASRLVTLAGDLERGHHTTGSRPVPASGDLAPAQGPSPRHPVDADRHVRVDIRSLPGALAEAAVTGRRTGPDHVEVRVDGWVERRHGLWARAFDPADDTLLALGPLRRDGRDAAAHLLVPPWAIRRVEVDITDRPEMPRPSTALAAVERAIHLGGVAARAERVGHRRAAGRRWRQCARAWQAAGDATRAEQALTYARVGLADHRPAGRVIRPLVSDLIERYG